MASATNPRATENSVQKSRGGWSRYANATSSGVSDRST